jgi:membrane protein required for colicin V production
MQVYDLIMLIVLVGATLIGFRKGFAWQVASLASIGVSYVVAMRFRDQLAPSMPYDEPWNKFLAMLVLYLGTSLVIWLLFRMVSGFIDQAKLSEFDRQLGGLLGAAKGVALCVIITLFAVSLLSEEQRRTVIDSKSGYYIASLLHKSRRLIPEELHELLDPYLHQLDERLTPAERERLDQQPWTLPGASATPISAANGAGEQPASGGSATPAPAWWTRLSGPSESTAPNAPANPSSGTQSAADNDSWSTSEPSAAQPRRPAVESSHWRY